MNEYEYRGVIVRESPIGLIEVRKGETIYAMTTSTPHAVRRFIDAVQGRD